MAKRPTRALDRVARLGGLAGRMTGAYLGQGVRRVLADGDTRERLKRRLQIDNAERVVETVGRLKGAAMKVGQSAAMLATALELPDEVTHVLERLHDDVEPIPFAQISGQIEESLERPLTELFAEIDPVPLGTASLGQAHAAKLADGRAVVVKVLHEGIEDSVDSDLAALRAMLVGSRILRRGKKEMDEVFGEIRARLVEELDYLQEAANIEAFARAYEGDDRVRIPKTHPSCSSERVLTMDRLPGLHLEEFLENASPEARQRAGMTLAELFYEMNFRHLMLHADPHPGNYLFEPDGRVGLLDFGCVKRFDEFWMGEYGAMAVAAIRGDRERVLSGAQQLGVWQGNTPAAGDALWAYCEALIRIYRQPSLRIGGPEDKVIEWTTEASKRLLLFPEIKASSELVFHFRALSGIYSIGRRLGPEACWGELLEEHAGYAAARANGELKT